MGRAFHSTCESVCGIISGMVDASYGPDAMDGLSMQDMGFAVTGAVVATFWPDAMAGVVAMSSCCLSEDLAEHVGEFSPVLD